MDTLGGLEMRNEQQESAACGGGTRRVRKLTWDTDKGGRSNHQRGAKAVVQTKLDAKTTRFSSLCSLVVLDGKQNNITNRIGFIKRILDA